MDRSSVGSVLSWRTKGERIPLKRLEGEGHGTRCAPYGGRFNFIVACMAFITVIITIALVVQIAKNPSQLQSIPGMLVVDSEKCSAVAVSVLRDGGNAVDASVAALLCLCVTLPHAVSIGGGGFMMIHTDNNDDYVIIDFREMAPDAIPLTEPGKRVTNASVIAVPGVLHGLQNVHTKFGSLPWKRLVLPATNLAEDGFYVSKYLADAVERNPPKDVNLQELLIPAGKPVNAGDKVVWKTLGKTLRVIASEGVDAFYSGNLTDMILKDLNQQGSVLTRKDFESYHAISEMAIKVTTEDATMYVPALPSSGLAVSLTFSLLALLNDSVSPSLENRHLIEAMKIATAAVVMGGSPVDLEESLNTSQNILRPESVAELSKHMKDNVEVALDTVPTLRTMPASTSFIIEANGMSVAVVSGLGNVFGSHVVSHGIVFNNAMEDFFSHALPVEYDNNKYAPRRRPLSTMALIALQRNDSPCGSSLMASSSDYQLLAHGLFGFEREHSLTEGFRKPQARFTLDGTQRDIAIERNNKPNSEIDKHVPIEDQGFAASVSVYWRTGDNTEIYSQAN